MDRTFERVLVVVAVSALAVAVAACTEGGGSEADPGGTPPGSRSEAPETVIPIPEGQSLMDPGRYMAQTQPPITLTTTTPWYGAANVLRHPDWFTAGQARQTVEGWWQALREPRPATFLDELPRYDVAVTVAAQR